MNMFQYLEKIKILKMNFEDQVTDKVKKVFLTDSDDVASKLLMGLTNSLGLPTFNRTLVLYFVKNGGLKLSCNQNSTVLTYPGKVRWKSFEKSFSLRSQFLGTVINFLYRTGIREAVISNAIELDFEPNQLFTVKYVGGSLISKHQFEINYEIEKTKKIPMVVQDIINKSLEEEELNSLKQKVDKPEILLVDHDMPNSKIVQFCKDANLSWSESTSTTYFHKLSSVSNDYSKLNEIFKVLCNKEIYDNKPLDGPIKKSLPSLSIIIPCFNSEKSIHKTLLSINSQLYLPKDLEVVLVDDCSNIPVKKIINENNFKFKIQILRNETNAGISQARNIGAIASNNNILLFIDSDVVLSNNYLYEHLARHKTFPNIILVSFKENLQNDDLKISEDQIKKGVDQPNYRLDTRYSKYLDSKSAGYYKDTYIQEGDVFHILSETNYFKDLGHGRRIGVYDLPSMVIGHNFSVSKSLFNNVGGFINKMSGYGLEDSLFGIKAICKGAYVIPILSCGVFHIDHLPRRGPVKQIAHEFDINASIVSKLLGSKIEELINAIG